MMCSVVWAIVASFVMSHKARANETTFNGEISFEFEVMQKLIQLENDNRNLRKIVSNLTDGQEGKCKWQIFISEMTFT